MPANPGGGLLWVVPILLVMLLGGLMTLRPYEVARFNEQIDAIGSRRRHSEVEPTDWNVGLHRLCGLALLLISGLIATDVLL